MKHFILSIILIFSCAQSRAMDPLNIVMQDLDSQSGQHVLVCMFCSMHSCICQAHVSDWVKESAPLDFGSIGDEQSFFERESSLDTLVAEYSQQSSAGQALLVSATPSPTIITQPSEEEQLRRASVVGEPSSKRRRSFLLERETSTKRQKGLAPYKCACGKKANAMPELNKHRRSCFQFKKAQFVGILNNWQSKGRRTDNDFYAFVQEYRDEILEQFDTDVHRAEFEALFVKLKLPINRIFSLGRRARNRQRS